LPLELRLCEEASEKAGPARHEDRGKDQDSLKDRTRIPQAAIHQRIAYPARQGFWLLALGLLFAAARNGFLRPKPDSFRHAIQVAGGPDQGEDNGGEAKHSNRT